MTNAWTPSRRAMVRAGVGAAAAVALPSALRAATPVPHPRPDIDWVTLEPGEFLWEPDLSPEGPVTIIVSLDEQLVHVYRNGIKIAVSTCSTGKPGHRTPTGVFVVLQKDRDHHSSTYNNAPMPNMQRLTWDGIALHAGRLPGYPASHGCVRLPLKFSELLFSITHLGIAVIIADEKSEPNNVVHPGPVLPAAAEEQATAAIVAAAAKAHHPVDASLTSSDVFSIVVSGGSRKLEILKDGAEVFSSSILLKNPGRPLGNHMFKLLEVDPHDRAHTWFAHKIAWDTNDTVEPHDVLSRITVEDWAPFVETLADFRPGTIIVVTDEPLGDVARSGPGFVIIDGLSEV